MNQKFSGFKRTAIFLAAISAASVPATASAAWTITDLGTLSGAHSMAYGINDSGQVAGSAFTAGNAFQRAFITGANGAGMTDLGTLGGMHSYAYGINNSGQVVGWSFIADNVSLHSFLYSNGAMVDLNLLAPVAAAGWTGLQARDINNNGQIVGWGTLNGVNRAFLLEDVAPPVSAVPEPETCVMLLAGLGLLGFTARRRKVS